MARTQAERLAEKTVERQFLYELERDFELAPATSRALLETAQQVLLLSSPDRSVDSGLKGHQYCGFRPRFSIPRFLT
jgi:hypothetical protein